MKLRRCRPSQRFLKLLTWLCGLALLMAILEIVYPESEGGLSQFGLFLVVTLLAAAAFDRWLARRAPQIRLERQIPGSLPVGQWAAVKFQLHPGNETADFLELYDNYPGFCRTEGLPLKIDLRAGQWSNIAYQLRPTARGLARFPGVELRIASWMGLWDRQYWVEMLDEVKIFPNFSAIAGYSLMATDNHVSQLGIRRKQRRGEGTEFHQLREFRQGDSIRQLDWKATSRRLQLISREYQDERDQQIILLLDSGRRLRTHDDELSHFDHALNAALMLAYVALRQGDAVGMMSFGQAQRWTPAVKGAASISTLLNAFYDLHSGPQASDFLAAGQTLMTRQRKRALVVVLTNLRDEDDQDLLATVKLLRQRHLVLIANLREGVLDQALQTEVTDLDTALRYAGTVAYLKERQRLQERLQAEGVLVMDTVPQEMSVRLINRYLEIKRAGVL